MIERTHTGVALELALADPARRNALGLSMFDALESALREAAAAESAWSEAGGRTATAPPPLILRGLGPAFCAGFDLAAAMGEVDGQTSAATGDADGAPTGGDLMAKFIERLGGVLGALRRHPAPVIAAVHGAALAGGCALVSACDLVVVSADSTLGYPVHRIGVSPAVTSPTLAAAIGHGRARALMLSGELVDGVRAHQLGLATHVVRVGDRDALPDAARDSGARAGSESPADPSSAALAVLAEARRLAALLCTKGPRALRATKAWLNELDGSTDPSLSAGAVRASTALARGDEAATMLAAFWKSRSKESTPRRPHG